MNDTPASSEKSIVGGNGFVYVPFERVDSEVRWLYKAAAVCFALWVLVASWKRIP